MKGILVTLFILTIGCCNTNLPPKECGEHGYSHFVNFPQVERMAEMCMYAYASNDSIQEKYGLSGRVKITNIPSLEVKFFVYFDDMMNREFVVIRGTDNLENTKIDGKYRKRQNKKLTEYFDDSLVLNKKLDVYVHRGFNETADSVYHRVKNLLERRYTTFVTGHSLGGAAAALVYLNLYTDGKKMGMLYTFGQPKCLTTDGVKKYRCVPCIRFINEKDVVPLVPPSRWALGLITSIPLWKHGLYRHLGDEVILLKDSNYVYLEYHDAERLKVSSFWRHLGRKEVSVKDHSIHRYLDNLQIKKEVITEVEYRNRKDHD